ncbi:dTMP kinase [Aneurinibacillus sp. Ricciae_BoGa-3]|uniref:dTMP kinase n=1 Tax=Aneurinibacillus sp. Ricciae_BoGa-3 TaxID=3022697 RepID=UPI002341A4A3|nr:dTMP kinase [Aneurinibacillus sp. Ricciae_BoGa-3]WCK54611.1 dTMP kinase [Aneurinibacillus sp. Ricciae_BoGa-3]
MKGFFITFEGMDGSGKTTQIQLLYQNLKERGYDVIVTREPGGTAISDKIRTLILDPQNTEMQAMTEVLLYAASRAQHVREKIKPALDRGAIVLCDRFVDASIAYQGYGLQLPLDQVIGVNRIAADNLRPDRTYFLDIPMQKSRERLEARFGAEGLDRIERKPLDYHSRVREGFASLCRQEPDRVVIVGADREIEAIQKGIFEDLVRFIGKRD